MTSERLTQTHERDRSEHGRDGELEQPVGEHRGHGQRQRTAVQNHRSDQTAVGPPHAGRKRNQPPELADHVGEDQRRERHAAAEGGKGGDQSADVKDEVSDRTGDRLPLTGAQHLPRVRDPELERDRGGTQAPGDAVPALFASMRLSNRGNSATTAAAVQAAADRTAVSTTGTWPENQPSAATARAQPRMRSWGCW